MQIKETTTKTMTLDLGTVGKIHVSYKTPGTMIRIQVQERNDGSSTSREVPLTSGEVKDLCTVLTTIVKEVEESIAAANKKEK